MALTIGVKTNTICSFIDSLLSFAGIQFLAIHSNEFPTETSRKHVKDLFFWDLPGYIFTFLIEIHGLYWVVAFVPIVKGHLLVIQREQERRR